MLCVQTCPISYVSSTSSFPPSQKDLQEEAGWMNVCIVYFSGILLTRWHGIGAVGWKRNFFVVLFFLCASLFCVTAIWIKFLHFGQIKWQIWCGEWRIIYFTLQLSSLIIWWWCCCDAAPSPTPKKDSKKTEPYAELVSCFNSLNISGEEQWIAFEFYWFIWQTFGVYTLWHF